MSSAALLRTFWLLKVGLVAISRGRLVDKREFRAILPADLSRLSDARRLMGEVGASAGLSIERLFDLTVVVSEACANAIEHGPGAVEILGRVLSGRIVVTITNEGAFRNGLRSDPGQRSRGLGLPLMASLSDELRIASTRDGRTQVSLTFFL